MSLKVKSLDKENQTKKGLRKTLFRKIPHEKIPRPRVEICSTFRKKRPNVFFRSNHLSGNYGTCCALCSLAYNAPSFDPVHQAHPQSTESPTLCKPHESAAALYT